MFAEQDEYAAAVEYYSSIMTSDDALLVKRLVSLIPKAPPTARRYLRGHCRDAHELKEFFAENSHVFFVENGRVTLYEDHLETIREEAVTFFKERLEGYEKPVHFYKLKKEHLEVAPDDIASFVTRFYPGKEFKRFLRSRPDVFVIYPDHKVFLIETETLAFYEMMLENCVEKKLHFLKFRGHVGQAPPHIQEYVNRYYPGDDFQLFLRRNDDVFALDHAFNVSLVPVKDP